MTDPKQTVFPIGRTREGIRDVAQPPFRETPPVLADAILRRHRGRILDPAQAAQPSARRRIDRNGEESDPLAPIDYRPTAYVGDQLLIDADAVDELVSFVDRTNAEAVLAPGEVKVGLVPLRADRAQAGRRTGERPSAVRANLRTVDDDRQITAPPPDAWTFLQRLRNTDEQLGARASLNHLLLGTTLTGAPFNSGVTFNSGVPFNSGVTFNSGVAGPFEYAVPGWGGRAPVAWLGDVPPRTTMSRPPVVAVLDTGVADHDWLPDDIVERMVFNEESRQVEDATSYTGTLDPADVGKETVANLVDPLQGGIDPFFGHGTFISGLIRQGCPDAGILSIQLMGPDGVVEEAALLATLDYLIDRQLAAQAPDGDPGTAIDIVCLSLGYYHEDPADRLSDEPLRHRLDQLRSRGVLVVAAAGNDSTTRPFYPAALTEFRGGRLSASPAFPLPADALDGPPLISVGALNPDQSVALFSNGGDWVCCLSPGAALVSTVPVVNAGAQASTALGAPAGNGQVAASWRSTLDPDHYTGFATWSGTSFAAPVMAAAAVRRLCGAPDLDDITPAAAVHRTTAALTDLGFAVAR